MATTKQRFGILQTELDMSTKLTNLEEKTARLEKDFRSILLAATDLAGVVKKYVDKVETERQSWEMLELILESGCTSRDILDHVKIFFNFLLAKMASRRAEITDIKMLWHLIDTEGVKQTYLDSLKSFGFSEADEKHVQLLLAIIYKLQVDFEKEKSSHVNQSEKANGKFNADVEKCIQAMSIDLKINSDDTIEAKHASISCHNRKEACNTQAVRKSMVIPENDSMEMNLHTVKNVDIKQVKTDQVDKKYMKAVDSWHMDVGMRDVVKRMMAIVIYTLNVGRPNDPLSIISIIANTKDAKTSSEVKAV